MFYLTSCPEPLCEAFLVVFVLILETAKWERGRLCHLLEATWLIIKIASTIITVPVMYRVITLCRCFALPHLILQVPSEISIILIVNKRKSDTC